MEDSKPKDISKQLDKPFVVLREEVKSALINLGYKNTEIDKAFNELNKNAELVISEASKEKTFLQNLDFTNLLKETIYRINK